MEEDIARLEDSWQGVLDYGRDKNVIVPWSERVDFDQNASEGTICTLLKN